MTYGARLFLIVLASKFLIANPVPLEHPIIPKIDCNDLNGNGHPDFIAVNNSPSPRSLYHIEFKDSAIEYLWEYSMPENIQGYFADMILGDFNNDGELELIAAAYQSGSKEILYVFPTNITGFNGVSPQIMEVGKSSPPITHPRKLYPMKVDSDDYMTFILTQGGPKRRIIICKYMNGEINSVGAYGNNFLSQSMGPLELSLGNFDEDNIEDIFILSNGPNPEGYFIFSNGTEENVGLDNFHHLQLLHNRGVDLNFDGTDDLIMVNRVGGLISNIWGKQSIVLSESKIQDIVVKPDNGLIHLFSISQMGKIVHYTIDPLTKNILTSENIFPELMQTDIDHAYSLVTENHIFVTTNGGNPELWSLSLALDHMVETPLPAHLQKINSQTPDFVLNVGTIFFHPLEKDTAKTFLHFTEEHLPVGMKFNLDDIQLEWTPTISQLGFHEFSYILELRETGNLEMEIEGDKKLVSKKESVVEEKNTYLIYVNDPVRFNNEKNKLTIVNTKSFEWIIPINDNNVDAQLKVNKIQGHKSARFQILPWGNNGDTLNPHKAKFIWTPNTTEDNFQFALSVSDSFSEDTIAFSLNIHPAIDLSMNQTELNATANKALIISVKLTQSPPSEYYTYELINAPENMWVTKNGVINWIPMTTDVDENIFGIKVSDGVATAKLQYKIYVNAIPVISSRPSEPFIINLGDSLFFPIENFDMNVDSDLHWKLISGPRDMVLNSEGVLLWEGSQLDYHPYEIQLSDGMDSVQWNGSIYVNVPPTITSKPITFIPENNSYKYRLEAHDDNNMNPIDPYADTEIKFKLIQGPIGMEIDNQNILSWDPAENVSGKFPISIVATDGVDVTPQKFQIINNKSSIIIPMDSVAVEMDDTLSFLVKANATNMDNSLSYFIDDMPPGMTINNKSGLITWIPSKSDLGKHYLNLRVKDGNHTSSTKHELQIFVYVPPIFTGNLLKEAFVDLEYTGFLTGEDMFGEKLRDEETIIIEMTTMKDYDLSEYGRYLTWIPQKMDIGKQEIHIRVTDEFGFTKLHNHSISVFKNPCFQCEGLPEENPLDSTGCTDIAACNYDASATTDDGSCWLASSGCSCGDGKGSEVDECGLCNGDGIAAGACDCSGNVEDCAGKCGGGAEVDDCGICNGPGAIYECGCTDNGNANDGSSISNRETNWCYNQSSLQAFYMLEKITVDGRVVKGDGKLSDSKCWTSQNCDVLGAFIDRNGRDICVGWVYADSEGFTTIPIMGNDNSYTSGIYLVDGESAYLKIYDASNGSTLNVAPAEELPGFKNNGILIINGTSIANTNNKN